MAFKMKGNPYKMGSHSTKKTMAYMKSPLEQAKPDYPDIDGDGNTTESMKQAAADKKSSPAKNYKNPKDYKVFNLGNEPDAPFKQKIDMEDMDIGTEEEIRAQIDNLENRQYDPKIGSWSYLAGEGYGPEGRGDVVGETMSPEAFKKVWQEQNEGPGWKLDYEEYLRNKNYEAASTK
tara:strand:- start:2054 stop:2584 length:531 start_codon:yes stop_codon:yes gene_type:complete